MVWLCLKKHSVQSLSASLDPSLAAMTRKQRPKEMARATPIPSHRSNLPQLRLHPPRVPTWSLVPLHPQSPPFRSKIFVFLLILFISSHSCCPWMAHCASVVQWSFKIWLFPNKFSFVSRSMIGRRLPRLEAHTRRPYPLYQYPEPLWVPVRRCGGGTVSTLR